jgi:eukaryotic translation initiation factor 2C
MEQSQVRHSLININSAAETNGYRVEMISTENITSILKPMLMNWTQTVGGGKWPAQILYFRDGVSEGQYAHVLQQEVADMKDLLRTADSKLDIPFIVAVGGKRKHPLSMIFRGTFANYTEQF